MSSRAVPPGCECAEHGGARVLHQQETQLDVQLAAILAHRPGRQHATVVLGQAALDRLVVGIPVRTPEALRDDQVEAGAERIGGGMPEHAFGSPAPVADHAFAVGEDHRFGALPGARIVRVHVGFDYRVQRKFNREAVAGL